MARALMNADSAAGFGKASPRTVDELLRQAVWCRPAAPAVRDAAESMTYSELDEAADDCAAWLTHNGVRSGDRVVVRCPDSAFLVALILGIARAGGITVPVAPGMSDQQVSSVIEHAEPMIVVGETEDGCDVLRTLTTASVVSTEEIRQFTPTSVLSRRTPEPDDLFLLLYTSGSSPKGVMTTHRQAMFAVQSIARRLEYRADDAVFCRIPMSFDYGLYQLFLCLYSGAQLLIPPAGSDPALVDLIRSWNATVVPIVPSLGSTLAGLARQDPRPTLVRLFTNAGAALPPALAAALRSGFPGSRLCLMYGTTECKQVSITEPDGDLTHPGSVGRPIDGTRVRVVDEEGRDLPAGQVGEFVVHGPNVMSGYWRAATLTAIRFRGQAGTATRRLHTGDFGWTDDEGFLYFVGKRDEIFENRGVRVSASEIEACAQTVPGVHAAAALPPAEGRGAVVVVVADVASAEVVTGLRAVLEPAKVPERCHVVEALPLTVNGLVDRAALARSLSGLGDGLPGW